MARGITKGNHKGGQRGVEQPDMVGKKFNKLFVLRYEPEVSKQKGRDHYLVRCDCSTEKITDGLSLRGGVKSCGCLHREQLIKRNKDPNHIKKIWRNPVARKIQWRLSNEEQKLCDRWYCLVPTVVKQFAKYENIDFADLIQVGCIGLASAAHWYLKRKNELNIQFSTFAFQRIEGKIKEFIKKECKINFTVQQLRRIQDLYYLRTGRHLDDYELANITGIDIFDIRDLFLKTNEVYSLDVSPPDVEDEESFADLLEAEQLEPVQILALQEKVEKELPVFETEQQRRQKITDYRNMTDVEKRIEKVKKLKMQLEEISAGC